MTTLLHDFGGVLGRPWNTFSFRLSQSHGHSSWLVCEVALIGGQVSSFVGWMRSTLGHNISPPSLRPFKVLKEDLELGG